MKNNKLTLGFGLVIMSLGLLLGLKSEKRPVTNEELNQMYVVGAKLEEDWVWAYPEESPDLDINKVNTMLKEIEEIESTEKTVTELVENNKSLNGLEDWEEKELRRLKEEKDKARERLTQYVESKKRNIKYEQTAHVETRETPTPEVQESYNPIEGVVITANSKMYSQNKEEVEYEVFEATAYDLSYQSVQTREGDKRHGITRNGTDLKGKTREQTMTIATDPRVIPTGSVVEVIFTREGYEDFSGLYVARDTGGLIKGKIIDVFMGDFKSETPHPSVMAFGRQEVKVRVVSTPK